MAEVKIGSTSVGEGHPCYVVAEIGINHNGDIKLAKQLIDTAEAAGCNAVKFQKRTIDVVYTPEELAKPRESPFGETNGDLKRGLEFGLQQYHEIDRCCKEVGIAWFASCWDEASVDFIDQFDPPCYKIASACLTDDHLLRHTRDKGKPIVLATGMSTLEEIDHAVDVLGKKDLLILHAVSTYPSQYDELNLRIIPELKKRYGVPVGYSGHETGLPTSAAAVAMGACMVERHITMSRAMWGSDQAASLEPNGITRLMRDIRLIEMSMGTCEKRVLETEKPLIKKLPPRGRENVKPIKAVALDVNGVLTDGSFWWGLNGEEFKQFNFADVMGISLGRKAGLLFALISGEASAAGRSLRGEDGHCGRSQRLQGQSRRAAGLCRQERARPEGRLFHGRRRKRPARHGTGRLGGNARQRSTGRPPAGRRRYQRGGGQGAVRELIDMLLAERAK